MKKITLFITLIAFTFGFSQSFPVTFDSGVTVGDNWNGDSGLASVSVEAVPGDTSNNGLAGKIVSAASDDTEWPYPAGIFPWQNAQMSLQDNYIDLRTSTDQIISFDIYSDTAIDFLVKLEQTESGAAVFTQTSVSHGGSGWETLNANFSTIASPPNDQFKLLIFFPNYDAAAADFHPQPFESTTYVDNISGPVGDVIVTLSPTTNAPTPTVDAGDVISIYSDAYTDILGTDFNPNWGQSTAVNTAYDPTGEGTNTVIEYSSLNYQGTEFPTTDMSAMTKVHFDVWTANEATIQFTPISPGQENLVSVTSTGGTWTSIDLDLASNFSNVVLSDIFQLKFVGSGTVYLDNIYFYSEPLSTSPTTNAPTPTVDAGDVISIYSDAYTDILGTDFNPNWGQSTAVNTAYDPTGEGTNTVIEYSSLNYQGTEFPTTDMSAMTKVHFDVWTANEATIQFTPISPGQENLVSVTSTGGTWTSIDLDLASNFSNVVLSDIFQLKFVGSGTVYLDNIYFYSTPPTTTVTVDVSENPGGVNIQSNQNGWAEAAAFDNGDGTYSYTFENVAAGTVIEYKWILYTSATPTFEDLIPLVGGGGVDNDLAANLPTNETIVTDYGSYCNRAITASTTDVVAQTYFFNSFRQPGVDYPELVVTAPAGENLVIDYSSNGWSEYHGPGAVDNGDGTHTVLVDPSSAFQYKWVNTTTGVTEDLLSCDNNDPSIDTDNSTYANRVHAAGEDHNDVFGACPLPEGPTTSAPTPPTRDASDVFSLLSDAYTNETPGVNAFAGATIEDFVIGGTDNTLKVTAPTAGGGYQYVFGIPNGVDLSAFTHMHIDYFVTGEVAGGEVLQTFLQQFAAGDGAFQHNIVNTAAVTTTSSWVSIDVEISTMGSGELSRDNIGQIQMVLAGPAYGPIFLDNIYFYREATQGLDDNVFNTLKMFPNPAKDTVQFSINSNENLDIEIFDMLGKSVLRVIDVQNEVNISELNSGLYFVQMTLGTQQATKKLIVN